MPTISQLDDCMNKVVVAEQRAGISIDYYLYSQTKKRDMSEKQSFKVAKSNVIRVRPNQVRPEI